MDKEETAAWRRQRLESLVKEMGSSRALGEAIGHRNGDRIRHMLAGLSAISDKTMDAIEAMPGREHWFRREGGEGEGRAILGCLRYQRELLALMTEENRAIAKIALCRFIENPDEMLEVADLLRRLVDEV